MLVRIANDEGLDLGLLCFLAFCPSSVLVFESLEFLLYVKTASEIRQEFFYKTLANEGKFKVQV